MVYLFTGTPGSGKSLHTASRIYYNLKFGNKQILCNFPINQGMFKEKSLSKFLYLTNEEITPDFLVKYSMEYFRDNPSKSVGSFEGKICLYIDEAQLMFNARDWTSIHKAGWSKFFTQHRHLGYDIFLITQFDKMIDKQVLALVEYNYLHRKISNMGWKAKIFGMLFGLGRPLFYCSKIWYPMKDKVGGEFFRFSRKLNGLYDTHALFGYTEDIIEEKTIVEEVREKPQADTSTEHSTEEEREDEVPVLRATTTPVIRGLKIQEKIAIKPVNTRVKGVFSRFPILGCGEKNNTIN